MPNCTEMKTGEIYACPDCGLELQVVKSCSTESGEHSGSCSVEGGGCVLRCCDEELVLKKA